MRPKASTTSSRAFPRLVFRFLRSGWVLLVAIPLSSLAASAISVPTKRKGRGEEESRGRLNSVRGSGRRSSAPLEAVGGESHPADALLDLRGTSRRLLTSEKKSPEKGNPEDCESIWEDWLRNVEGNGAYRRPPCRHPPEKFRIPPTTSTPSPRDYSLPPPPPPPPALPPPPPPSPRSLPPAAQGDDETIRADDTSATNVATKEAVATDNRVWLTLYIALRPNHPGLGAFVFSLVSRYLNDTIGFLVLHHEDIDTEDAGASIYGQARPRGQTHSTEHAGQGGGIGVGVIELFLDKIEAQVFLELDDRWWWQHNVTFSCFWREDGAPVLDLVVLQNITSTVNERLDALARDGILLESLSEHAPPGAVLEVSADPPRHSHTTTGDATDPPLDDAIGTYHEQISRGWDWKRYVGLALFLGTLATCVTLTQVAYHRQRRREAQKPWCNLATEEGVDELLRTGWKVQKCGGGTSSRGRAQQRQVLEVYDKEKLGYLDDDSIFIGGFEQRDGTMILGGTEISATLEETTLSTPKRNNDTPDPW